MIFKSVGYNLQRYLYFIFLILFAFTIPIDTLAQRQKRSVAKPLANYKLFPDEYSELDEIPTPSSTKDEMVLKTLERSRQKYLQALILIERGDTTGAAKFFEDAIEILNQLVNFPDIEQNDDFTDLAQSIIEDYESFVQTIDNLDENSSLFIIRDKIFQEIDRYSKVSIPDIETIKFPKDSAALAHLPFNLTIPLDENEFVQKSIRFLTRDKGKKFFKLWLERSSRWFPMMRRIARDEGMPEEIIYLSMIESGLKPTIVSPAMAVGLWQFIRSTGEQYGLNAYSSFWVDERRDPEKSTRAAMRHLRDLYSELGNWHLALASYNCGINCVARALSKCTKENPSFWDVRDNLPKETRNYVPLYIAATKIALQPELYGFNLSELNYLEEYKYETYTITEPVSLPALARCANITVEKLCELNPELIKTCTPPDKTEYALKIPYGSKQIFANNFSKLNDEDKQPWVLHTVKKGETIASIAKKYGVSKHIIVTMNGLEGYNSRVRRGTTIRIPVEQADPASLASNESDNPKTTAQETNTAQPGKNGSGAKKQNGYNSHKSSDSYITHTVQKSETLYSIARQYGVRLADLRNLNDLSYNSEHIEAGTKLKISANTAYDSKTESKAKQKLVKHKVKSGETLAQIADDYEVSIESIKKLNKIKSSKIHSGQVLKIETTASVAANNNPVQDKTVVHKVKSGETLSTVAARYGVTEDQIKKWNSKTVSGNTIFAGTILKINPTSSSKGGSVDQSGKVNKLPKYYTIRKGDTISTIARKFGLTITALKSKNKNLSDKSIKSGQRIRLQ